MKTILKNRISFLLSKITMVVITTLFFSQCSQEEIYCPPIESCDIDHVSVLSRTVKVGDSLTFRSECIDNWEYSWTFPGGTPNESRRENPTITYNVPGTYSVKRTNWHGLPCTSSWPALVQERVNYVTVTAKVLPMAKFIASDTIIKVGDQINFSGQSEGAPTQWEWVFEGATPSSSTIKDPLGIVYNTVGTYDVSLTVTNEDGVNTLLKKTYIAVTEPLPYCSPVTDLDGNTYQVKEMGGKCWMTENLKTTKYKNGDAIATGLDSTNWVNATTGAFTHVDGDQANNNTYGKLYNGYAIFDSRGLCPSGWHAATQLEWDALIAAQGGESLAGGALRTTTGWASPNTGATNSSGFSALPAGFLTTNPFKYSTLTYHAYFWIATTTATNTAPYVLMQNGSSDLFRYDANYTAQGMSCRCVKD